MDGAKDGPKEEEKEREQGLRGKQGVAPREAPGERGRAAGEVRRLHVGGGRLLLVDVETLDPRGRTPLHLAVTLGHLDCARLLLQHGADVSKENRNGWTVSTRDPELVRLVLHYRDYQRTSKRLAGIPVLLERLHQAQDFYVEMKWEFTSWDSSAVVMEVDHDRQLVFCETLCVSSLTSPSPRRGTTGLGLLGALQPSEEQVAARLSAPVVTTQLDTKNITFERNKTGILGWRSEKTEMVNGYEAKVAPIIDLMAISNALFAKLRDFITLRLPPGFPVKIEIPIYHILNARITFGNLNGCEEGSVTGPGRVDGEVDGQKDSSPRTETDTPSPGSDSSSVSSSSSTREIPPCVFEPPQGYTVLGGNQRDNNMRGDEEEDLLQFAIQQSLLEAGSDRLQRSALSLHSTRYSTQPLFAKALACPSPAHWRPERFLAAFTAHNVSNPIVSSHPPSSSSRTPQHKPCPPASLCSTPTKKPPTACSYDQQLRLAMELSAREQAEAELRRRQEEEELQRIIQLSLLEK
ncbi:unnamed protein product [Coregonus sp. 'balchen']|nr:unnamed protein product [Coregonus sp. 'balchen']